MTHRLPGFGSAAPRPTSLSVARLVPLALALVLAVAAPQAASAQARGGAAADTLTTEQRLAERLRLLNRPPGADSATIAADSARLANRRGGARQQNRQIFQASDSIMEALLALEGYEITQYQGRTATWDAVQDRLILIGDSAQPARTLMNDGSRMESDTIDYRQETGDVYFRGREALVVPTDGEELRAAVMRFNTETERGAARDARTRVTEGGQWNIRGDLREISQQTTYGSHLQFTSCDLEEPHYHFAAKEYKWSRGGTIVARDVTLYFADVPVFKLPFIAQNTRSGRSSGLLAPRFSVNDIVRSSSGYSRRISNVGYYWAMSDYADATVALDWFDGNYTALTGGVRYSWLRQFLRGSLDFRQYWRDEGGTEMALNTNHSWEISERTQFRAQASYASSSSFVTNNSFNPAEVTQSIDSQGGLNRRFDWGSVQLSANRRQFLSDDRIEMTLPSVNLSLSTITLFPAAPAVARWYNNLAWSGSARFSRSISDLSQENDPGNVDTGQLQYGLNSSLNLGNLRVSGGATQQERSAFDVVRDSLAFFPGLVAEQGTAAFSGRAWDRELIAMGLADGELVDITDSERTWNASIDYQQTLIGSTTLTPNVSIRGRQVQRDTSQIAQDWVSAPTRVSFGATLRSDIYGFYPGFAGFERFRHKISPSITYDYAPEVTPNELQRQVFGARGQLPENVIAVTLNQTFEAKRPPPNRDEPAAGAAAADAPAGAESGADPAAAGALPGQPAAGGPSGAPGDDGLRRIEDGEIVNLLALRTSVIRYNFASDSTGGGSFLDGFETVRLSNQISSDFLRGLTVSMAHELFDERPVGDGEETERVFDPHLSQLNLGFQISNRSSIFSWIPFLGGGDGDRGGDEDELFADDDAQTGDPLRDDPLGLGSTDETSMIPGRRTVRDPSGPSTSGVGEWSASLSYAMTRPREEIPGQGSSSLQANLRLQPTAQWEMSWNTSYDFQRNAFNDHAIRLSRDLHRWRANFDFLQTATGNWTFRFEVSLIDNRDLNFDYQQRQRAITQRRR